MPLSDTLVIQHELLPRGANGFVFLAHDTVLQREVVVKVWIGHSDDARDKIAQGLAEARKIANLRHPNIGVVFSAVQPTNDVLFLTMEHLGGPTLQSWLETPDIDFVDRYRIWHEIRKGVEYAHHRGIYHGDLHPGNVVFSGTSPKIIDFGASLFAHRRDDILVSETRLTIDLTQNLFHEHTRMELTCEDWYELRPEVALQACCGWVELLWLQQDLMRRQSIGSGLDDYDCRSAGFRISMTLRYSPLFCLPAITQWFRNIVEEEIYVLSMLDSVRTELEDVFSPKCERVIRTDPSGTATDRLDAIQDLAQRVRSHFRTTGPWE